MSPQGVQGNMFIFSGIYSLRLLLYSDLNSKYRDFFTVSTSLLHDGSNDLNSDRCIQSTHNRN